MNHKAITIAAGTVLATALTTTLAGPGSSCSSDSSATKQANTTAEMTRVSYTAKKDIIDTAVAAGSFNTLAAALTKADLIGALKGKGPFTVFAPTDEAFAKLPKGTVESLLKPENRDMLISILTYHVVPGELDAGEVLGSATLTTLNGQRVDISKKDASIDGVSIVKTDIECTNGVIHVIDEVILPQSDTILEIASSAGSFNTLAAALEAADLIDAISGDGPLTVFAPTDEAFAALPDGTLDMLLQPENKDKLRSILLYHVVEGRVYADQAIEAGEAATLQGGEVKIKKSWGDVKVNDAKVVTPDLEASNGVIHVIDRVILPKG
ncbi:MAG: fasciclin domain-containing protein [Phycisphaerales bacterium JB047]